MHFTRKIRHVVLASALGLAFLLGGASPASAHHPVLSADTSRPCGDSAPWSVDVTVQSDADYNKNWQNKYQVDGGAYTGYSSYVDDQVDYSIDLGPFAASKTSVVVNVTSHWINKTNTDGQVTQSGSITVNRPASTECPPPPCEEGDFGTPGHCIPPCQYNPNIPETSDDCKPPVKPPFCVRHPEAKECKPVLIPPVVIERPAPAVPAPTAPTFTG